MNGGLSAKAMCMVSLPVIEIDSPGFSTGWLATFGLRQQTAIYFGYC